MSLMISNYQVQNFFQLQQSYLRFLAFSHLVKSTKSAILPWGLVENIFNVDDIIELSLLELDHQAEKWGNRREYHDYSKIITAKKVLICNLFLNA